MAIAPDPMDFIEVADVSDVPVGRAKACALGGRTIALYHTPDGFFATTNTCPHRGGPLAEGDLMGQEIVCPWHFWSFNVATGENVADPSLQIQTYEVRVEGDRVLVRQT
jgi:nitrite reductase/ring-hydroxylating ferredoxin subunit